MIINKKQCIQLLSKKKATLGLLGFTLFQTESGQSLLFPQICSKWWHLYITFSECGEHYRSCYALLIDCPSFHLSVVAIRVVSRIPAVADTLSSSMPRKLFYFHVDIIYLLSPKSYFAVLLPLKYTRKVSDRKFAVTRAAELSETPHK